MRARWTAAGLGLLGLVLPGPAGAADGDRPDGRELFFREWTPNDPRSRGGDGLGPVYNERSCFACHAQGGPGGGGKNEHNVDLVSVIRDARPAVETPRRIDQARIVPRPLDESNQQRQAKNEARRRSREIDRELAELIPGLSGSTIVVHKFGVDLDFNHWRTTTIGLPDSAREGAPAQATLNLSNNPGRGFRFVRGARSTPPLFGSGKIDAIPDRVLRSAAAQVFPAFPEITGRVARTAEGEIGRFGWKGQTARLDEFVLAACSNELGLEVPGHPQAPDPRFPEAKARGLDLSAEDCKALTEFVANLPEPVERKTPSDVERSRIESGRAVFETIGCAACHTPDLGSVKGLYSDLLLHDLGDGLQSAGSGYGEPAPPPSPSDPSPGSIATEKEWRTTPLWGLSDSAPFLHDGRATNLDDAIQGHGGEATATARRYFQLEKAKKLALKTFLGTLSAPKMD